MTNHTVDIFRYSDIAEAGTPILNPLSEDKLLLLGELAELAPGMRQLDLACGKGEMLCQYAARHGITGTGIDIHPPFIDAAKERAVELGVADRLDFQVGDAGRPSTAAGYDVVTCIGATWIGGGFDGTLELMKRAATADAPLLVGEVFLEHAAPDDVDGRHAGTLRGISDLGRLLDRIESAGLSLVEMVLATRDDWDRYSSRQWARTHAWLQAHGDDPDAAGIREWTERSRRTYLADERRWLGWGVFVLRP